MKVGLGVAAALLAALLFVLGNVLEKRSVDRLPALSAARPVSSALSLATSPWWLAGALASVLGVAAQIAAYSRISISVVQSFGIGGAVVLALLGRHHFDEVYRRRELVGLALSLAALAATGFSLGQGGNSPGTRAGPVAVAVALGATGLLVLAAGLHRPTRGRDADITGGIASGLLYGIAGLADKGLSTISRAGDLGSLLVRALESPYLYILGVSWVAALMTFQLGLQKGRVGVIGPLSGVISATYVVTVGTPLFGEHFPSGASAFALRLGGLIGVLVGSLLLAWRPGVDGGHLEARDT